MKNITLNSQKQNFNEAVKLEACFSAEQEYIWKKMLKIEKIKKENSLQKNSLLRQTARAN